MKRDHGQQPGGSLPTYNGAVKLLTTRSLGAEVMSVRISPERDCCAAALFDGVVELLPLPTKGCKFSPLQLRADDETLPATDIAFVPKQGSRKKLLVSYASGFVRLWQYSAVKAKANLWKAWRELASNIEQKSGEYNFNQVLTISASFDGLRFVTGGVDCDLRVYVIKTSTVGRSLNPSMRTDPIVLHNFHVDRITAVTYHSKGARDETFAHTVITASWDNTIQGWDDRTCGSMWQYIGVNVAGADGLAIDPIHNIVITASYRRDMCLSETWEARLAAVSDDRKSLSRMTQPLSKINQEAGDPVIQVYVARLAHENNYLIFGGTDHNMLKILHCTTLRTIGSVVNLPTGIYSADSCSDPGDKKHFLIAFTNGVKVYFVQADAKVPHGPAVGVLASQQQPTQ